MSHSFQVYEAFSAFVARHNKLGQGLVEIAKRANDFTNIPAHERDNGYGLFSLQARAIPTILVVRKRARTKLSGDAYLHSGRIEVFSCRPVLIHAIDLLSAIERKNH